MIFSSLITFFLNIVTWVIGFLPSADSEIISFLESSVAVIVDSMGQWDWLFPVQTMLWLFATILVLESALIGWKFIKWMGSFFGR